MAVWVNPFTGRPVDSDTPPLGGPYPAIPAGNAIYQGDPSDMGGAYNVIPVTAGGGTPTLTGDLTFTGGYGFQAARGAAFYMPGDEWRIISSYGDIANLQAALEAIGVLSGNYIVGQPDAKTAEAMKKVLEAANASGLSWEQVLSGGLDAAQSAGGGRGGGGGGGGGGGAAVLTDDDIRAFANQTAQNVLGRDLRTEEIDAFIPAFRAALTSGTSASVVSENLIRKETAPTESNAHDIGGVMQSIQKLLGG